MASDLEENFLEEVIAKSNLTNDESRPPIITIMGHVDHGDLSKFSSVTSGSIYYEVITDERNGKYDGKTVLDVYYLKVRILFSRRIKI